MFVMALGVFAQERREQPTSEQIQAYLRTLTSHPDQHILSPAPEAAKVSPYRRPWFRQRRLQGPCGCGQ